MTVSLRLNDKESALIKNSVIGKIEDEYDERAYEQAVAEYKNDSKTYTVEEVGKMLEAD